LARQRCSPRRHFVGHWCASVLVYWHSHYFLHGEVITFGIALPLLGLLGPIVRSRLNEMATVRAWPRANAAVERIVARIGAGTQHEYAESLDPYSRLPRAARHAVALPLSRWRGSTIRISSAWSSSTTHPIRRSGNRSRRAAASSVRASSCLRRQPWGFKAAALRLGWRKPLTMPRSSALSTPDYVVDPPGFRDTGPPLRRPRGRTDSGAAGSSRRRTRHIHAAMNAEYAVLRYRHGRAQRGQRHHRPRHDVPDPPHRHGDRRRLVERHDLRRQRPRLTIMDARVACPNYTNRRYGWGCCRDYLPSRPNAALGPAARCRS